MITIRTSPTATALDRASKIVQDTPGLLSEILNKHSVPKIERLIPEAVEVPPEPSTFLFGSEKSRRWYFWALDEGLLPFREIQVHGRTRRVYRRQGVLIKGFSVIADARSRASGIIRIVNDATDALGRRYPRFVFNPPASANYDERQQPGHFGRWQVQWEYLQKEARRIVSEDINREVRKQFPFGFKKKRRG